MNISTITRELNELSARLYDGKFLQKITFFSGEIPSQTAEYCAKTCPFCKVAVLYTKEGFINNGDELSYQLKKRGIKPVNIIFESENINQAELDKTISSMPETVRIILTVDQTLLEFAGALAKELKLVCALGVFDLPDKTVVLPKTLPEQTGIILSQDLKVVESKSYSVAVSKIISLLDIKLKQFLKIIPKNFELTDEFIQILESVLEILSYSKTQRGYKLLEIIFGLEILERALGHYSTPLELTATLCVIKMLATELTKERLETPNYVERARELSDKYNENYFQTLLEFKSQLNIFESHVQQMTDIKKGLSALAKMYLDKSGLIVKTFKEFKGRRQSPLKDIYAKIKYAGDKPYNIGCISLLRETGALELN